ncbi:MAG: glycosyltransferase family 4 protein [Leptolyngbyaceae bacterium]|nr:glycosyltransferase family 4 protein [Leptolyngbyaceae bacterium]
MKILFLDQSGKPGGAELCLLDTAKPYRDRCLVALFTDGPFRQLLEAQQVPVKILGTQAIRIQKESTFVQGLSSLERLLPLIVETTRLSQNYDLIYANTQKALVVGAIASVLSHRPLVYHLHDILSLDHFSPANRAIAVKLANRFASLVIANSQATQAAFVAAGGQLNRTQVVYNGFEPERYSQIHTDRNQIRQQLDLLNPGFLVGHFSRLSPWKGQHILLNALAQCPTEIGAIFVGDALFGEQAYAQQLQEQVIQLNLQDRVQFLGFRSDIVPLMAACDLVAHTSTAPEPFGRVIVEAMLCGRPVLAAGAGGAVELVEPGKTGWLVPPGDADALARAIATCYTQSEETSRVANQAQIQARHRFHLTSINQQIAQLLDRVGSDRRFLAQHPLTQYPS